MISSFVAVGYISRKTLTSLLVHMVIFSFPYQSASVMQADFFYKSSSLKRASAARTAA